MATKYRWDAFVLDLDAYRLERGGQPLTLEPKAFNLLALMVPRPGHLFTKQEIFEAVWPGVAVTDHALTRVVAQVRRVLGDEAREARYLETVPTRGYRWLPATEIVCDTPPVVGAIMPSVTAQAPPVPAMMPRSPSASGWMVATTLLAMLMLTVIWTQRATPESGSANDTKWVPANWPAQLTTHTGVEMHPAWSPHGDAMAYAANRTGVFEIYVRALQGPATETALTDDAGENVQPAWSPDGRFVAYHSYVRGGIWVVPARGGTARQVVAIGSRPAWTRDSRHLVFQSDEHADISPDGFSAQNGSTLWRVTLDGSDRRPLTRIGHPIGGHAAPVVSPDGRFIAFTVFDGGPSSGLWMLDTVSGQTWRVTENVRVYEATFAPDGTALFASGGIARIIEIPLDRASGRAAGPPRFLPVPEVPGLRGLALSPDGRTFSFFGATLSSQIWAQRLDADGRPAGDPAPLTSDTSRRNSWPSISPDGSRIAYASTRRGQRPNVWMLSLDGGEPVQLSADAEGSYQPRWIAGGTRVAYLRERGGTREVWAVDAETRRTDQLLDIDRVGRTSPVPLRGVLAELALAPSLRRAVFSTLVPPDGRRVLHYATLDPFEPRALTADTQSVGYPAWAPDERRVAVELRDEHGTQAAIVDTRTGDLRVLTRDRGETWVRSWSPDGRRVAAAALRAGVWHLGWFDVTTGQGGALTAPTPSHIYQRYPEWSPRGDLVVFERAEMSGDLWLLPVRRQEQSHGR